MKLLTDPDCSLDLVLGTTARNSNQLFRLTPEPIGIRLSALVNRAGTAVEFLRRDGTPVTRTDLLLSDHYTGAQEAFRQVFIDYGLPSGCLVNFVYDYAPGGRLYFDAPSVRSMRQKLGEGIDKVLHDHQIHDLLPDGNLTPELISYLRTKDVEAIWGWANKVLGEGHRFWSLGLRRGSYSLRIALPKDVAPQALKYEHSNLYSLLGVEAVRLAKPEILAHRSDSTDPYVSLVDTLFIQYLGYSKYDLAALDLDMPEALQVCVTAKLPLLSKQVGEIIKAEPELFDVYRLILSLYRQRTLHGNPYATSETIAKHQQMLVHLSEIQEHGVVAVPLPAFIPSK